MSPGLPAAIAVSQGVALGFDGMDRALARLRPSGIYGTGGDPKSSRRGTLFFMA